MHRASPPGLPEGADATPPRAHRDAVATAGGDALRLTGSVAAVTGGGAGIGRACVLALATAGAHVVALDRDPGAAPALAREATSLPGRVVPLTGDATSCDDLSRVVDEAAGLGGLAAAVNVVGAPGRDGRPPYVGPTMEMDPAAFVPVFADTLLPPLLGCQVLGQAIAERGGGSIVNIGASLALRAAPHHGAFAAAKAALHQLTQTLAFELAPRRVRVNCIAPLFVDTPGARAAVSEGRRALSAAAIPLGRIATATDVAGLVLFLVSELSAFVTGQTLVADGGLFSTTLRPPRGWVPSPAYLEQLRALAGDRPEGPGGPGGPAGGA